jgi:shikimate dehydrogenase
MAGKNSILYGVLGHPLGHTMSPAMFSEILPSISPGSTYLAWDIPPKELDRFFDAAGLLGIAGLSVTIPYKQTVLRYLHQQSPAVRAIGATNCLTFKGGKWRGYNTDSDAFRETLRARSLRPRSALVLGAGGAARAAIYALEAKGCTAITIAARRPKVVASELFFASRPIVPFDDQLSSIAVDHEIIVNATPVGMYPDRDLTPLARGFRPGQVAYDIVYNPRNTRFLSLAEEAGATAINGLEMLARQAAIALTHFTGAKVAWEKFFKAAERGLMSQASG